MCVNDSRRYPKHNQNSLVTTVSVRRVAVTAVKCATVSVTKMSVIVDSVSVSSNT